MLADQRLRNIFIETDANTHDDCLAIMEQAGFELQAKYENPVSGEADRTSNLILRRA